MGLKEKFSRFKDVNWLVYALIVIFGMSSWIDTYGMWVELPILVQNLPEGWQLPSYMTIVIQVANIAPLIYVAIISRWPRLRLETPVNYAIIVIGAVSCLLLAFLWNKTSEIAGSQRSTALMGLQFALAFVDCTSCVTYLPFLHTFKPQYMTSYFVGEGFSALVPSLIALIQGAGAMTCVKVPSPQNSSVAREESGTSSGNNFNSSLRIGNVELLGNPITTMSMTHFQDTDRINVSSKSSISNDRVESFIVIPKYLDPKFSVQVFFIILMIILILSGLSFTLLNFAGFCKQEYATISEQNAGGHVQEGELKAISEEPDSVKTSSIYIVDDGEAKESKEKNKEETKTGTVEEDESEFDGKSTGGSASKKKLSRAKYFLFLIITGWVSGLAFGILPPIQSYSCLPYGIEPYHLSVTLSCAVQPFAFFLSYFFQMSSTKKTLMATFLATGLAGYLAWTAAASPEPPLVDHVAGSIILVICWVGISAVINYIRACTATVCRNEGKMALVWVGAWTQIGALTGTIVGFLLVSVFQVFREANPCM